MEAASAAEASPRLKGGGRFCGRSLAAAKGYGRVLPAVRIERVMLASLAL